MTPTFPDYMLDIRAWLRAHPDLTDLVAGRVFFRIPPKVSKAPFIRIYQSGGGPQEDAMDAPVLDIRVGIDVWGITGKDYANVRRVTTALFGIAHDTPALTEIVGPTSPSYGWGNTVLMNLSITTSVDSPDADTGWPRMVLDAIWTVRSA